jgi:hypothetical protein
MRVYAELLGAVRIHTGATAHCELRLTARYDAAWVQARAALAEKCSKARRNADRAGLDLRLSAPPPAGR